MGTIGHHTLLYDLQNWQIRSAIRGYYRQQRPTYEAARMLGLWTISCQRSKNSPPLHLTDLVQFSWDNIRAEEISEEEVNELLDIMRAENEKILSGGEIPLFV